MITLGSAYVVVMAVRYRVSPVLFSTFASPSNRLKMKFKSPGSIEGGRESMIQVAPEQHSGEVSSARTPRIPLMRGRVLFGFVSMVSFMALLLCEECRLAGCDHHPSG